MTRRLTVDWPDPRPFAGRDGRPIRILAASDDVDPTLESVHNREALGQVDLILGAGDLSPSWLCFLGDAFRAPLAFVRGNHDRGGPWPSPDTIPTPAAGLDARSLPGIPILALPWPSFRRDAAPRDGRDAWLQVSRLATGSLLRGRGGVLVLSHVPPRDAGDTPSDAYHVGFDAYRLVARRLHPPLWIHGHTNPAAQADWRVAYGPTTVVNVTGSVLVELRPAASRPPTD